MQLDNCVIVIKKLRTPTKDINIDRLSLSRQIRGSFSQEKGSRPSWTIPTEVLREILTKASASLASICCCFFFSKMFTECD